MGHDFDQPTAVGGASSAFVESLYARYRDNPEAVDAEWRRYFDHLEAGSGQVAQGPSWARTDQWPPLPDDDLTAGLDPLAMTPEARAPTPRADKPMSAEQVHKATVDSIRALMMIRAYRVRGHLIANLDPLGLEERPPHSELDPESYGFGPGDRDRPIFIDNVMGLKTATINEILAILRRTYCASVGVEFMHINEPDEKRWIQEKIEGREKEIQFTREGKRAILNKLIEAEQFEKFLGKKYLGTKRFGLDGGESIIPALEGVIKTGGQNGVKEIVLGMPHRGRLNVLANVMKKPYRAIFHEFQGGAAHPEEVEGSGDVKYHLGTSTDREFDGNSVHLSLTANPSHLEAVDPVVLGKSRAKQTQAQDSDRTSVLSLLLHGDAAFAGQGLVAECFAFSNLRGYRTGGTIHFIVNNQIGFTTSPIYSRSSPYPSDVAKMVQAPIFHVNGDDPEAVVFVTKLATEFRQRFKKDVVIDMFCYRRFGHNESDEPSFTQPLMYAAIKKHPSVIELYTRRLIEEGVVTQDEIDQRAREFIATLEEEMDIAEGYKPNKADWLEGRWSGMKRPVIEDRPSARRADTGVDDVTLREIGDSLCTLPDTFHPHRTLSRILNAKSQMFQTGENFDWATAEALAFGSLLKDGYHVRLSGQDSGRGTFSQRHAIYVDQRSENRYVPLQHVGAGKFEVLDSPLSEYGVLGFEYGYSLAEPNALVLWEAQFGDFANGAQVIVDQFIASGEIKWLRMSGLVMLLPHGYEGQGPEHSSARLERYLQLCAEDNMQVCNITSPANYFHVLRRQLLRDFRKPLIIMTPKSLLRHKKAVSDLTHMGPGTQFHRVLFDDAEDGRVSQLKLKPDDQIERIVFCSGKVYYDLLEQRDGDGKDSIYLARVEQLYPFPYEAVGELLARFNKVKDVIWCQEEPKNAGAWQFINPLLEEAMVQADITPKRPVYVGRRPHAATATGLASRHKAEQDALVAQALDLQGS
ncbi:MAG: 2-oxoglutarate dehydrogenase E1 component [Rhodothalassiaceae bacterium]